MASSRSGRIAGAIAEASSSLDRVCRASPTASRVPSTVAIAVAPTAMTREVRSEERIRSSAASSPYHRKLKPSQEYAEPPSLNDIATSTAIGM